ncbi:DUF3187 family protein [Vibrio gigantis]|uniref:DUF3187 family protein n=1 Tax=Vibrio gigantis TaxID=296199 RepID=UPI0035A67186
MRKHILSLITLLLCLPMASQASQVSVTEGKPLRTSASSPYQSTRLSTQLVSAFKDHKAEFYFTNSASSVWAVDSDYQLDYYQTNITVGMKLDTGEKFTTGIEYQYTWANDNGLDSFVMNFHDLFGVGQNGRDEVEEDRFYASSGRYGVEQEGFEDETFVDALKVDLQYHWWETETDALSVTGLVYFNDPGDDSFRDDAFEYGLQVSYSRDIEQHNFHSTLGLIRRSDSTNLESMEIRNVTAELGLGYVYVLSKHHQFMVEYYIYQGAIDDGSAFSKPSQEVTLGYRYNFLDVGAVELSTTENIGNMDNSTDIMFTLGFRLFI